VKSDIGVGLPGCLPFRTDFEEFDFFFEIWLSLPAPDKENMHKFFFGIRGFSCEKFF